MVHAGNDVIFALRERRPVSSRQILAYLSLCILLALLPGLARGEHPEILLIADPDMDNPIFQRSVILVTPHENGGAMGVILNRPIPVDPARLYPGYELLAEAEQVFFGGPVRPGLLIYLFRADTAPEQAVHLFGDVYFSIDRELLASQLRRPREESSLQLYAGYSGWAPGQLQAEILHGGWSVIEANTELLFDTDRNQIWYQLTQGQREAWY